MNTLLALLLSLPTSASALPNPTGCQVVVFQYVSNVKDPKNVWHNPDVTYKKVQSHYFSIYNGQNLERAKVVFPIDEKLSVVVWDNRASEENPDTIGVLPFFESGEEFEAGYISAMGWEGRQAYLFNDGRGDHVIDTYCWRTH